MPLALPVSGIAGKIPGVFISQGYILIRPAGKTTKAQSSTRFIGSVLAVMWCPQQLADHGDRNNCRKTNGKLK